MIMIPKYLSALWDATAPALANHLWQSTLFAVAAGLLTLALRQQHARIRYWLPQHDAHGERRTCLARNAFGFPH
jgi:hypothetical protein